jgi:hypothetical protein
MENLQSDKRCWEEVAMKAHLKIIKLENQIKSENKKILEMQELLDKQQTEINNLNRQIESKF